MYSYTYSYYEYILVLMYSYTYSYAQLLHALYVACTLLLAADMLYQLLTCFTAQLLHALYVACSLHPHSNIPGKHKKLDVLALRMLPEVPGHIYSSITHRKESIVVCSSTQTTYYCEDTPNTHYIRHIYIWAGFKAHRAAQCGVEAGMCVCVCVYTYVSIYVLYQLLTCFTSC